MAFDYNQLFSSRTGAPLAVAEIGTAHGGDLQRGLELIDAAAEAGADIAKVQVVFADEILPPEAGLVPLPGGPTPLFSVLQAMERPLAFYASLAERAESRGMGFLGTPYGEKSIRLLEELGVHAWKVASPELNHDPLLERLTITGLPLILSTGVSQPEDIEHALDVIRSISLKSGNNDSSPSVILLHCLTSYPAPEEQANLRGIPSMATQFNMPAGLSDHSLDPVLLPSLGVALGAVLVEKHITLHHGGGGLDDAVALVPKDFARMTAAMRRYSPFGNSKQNDSEHLKYVIEDLIPAYNRNRIEATLGNGILGLAASERPHYRRTNRSIHAIGALHAGTELHPGNTAILRTEKVLRPGIPPRDRLGMYGRCLVRDVASGDGITWEDIKPLDG